MPVKVWSQLNAPSGHTFFLQISLESFNENGKVLVMYTSMWLAYDLSIPAKDLIWTGWAHLIHQHLSKGSMLGYGSLSRV